MRREQIGTVGVDAGLIWVGEPCYILHTESTPKSIGVDWSDFCERLHDADTQEFPFDRGHAGLGVVVGGFGGDGCYPVFVERNSTGLVTRIVVEFGND